jgi:hypothetical protein
MDLQQVCLTLSTSVPRCHAAVYSAAVAGTLHNSVASTILAFSRTETILILNW